MTSTLQVIDNPNYFSVITDCWVLLLLLVIYSKLTCLQFSFHVLRNSDGTYFNLFTTMNKTIAEARKY